MKLKLFYGALLVIGLSIVSMGTLAYYTVSNTATNIITMGNIDVALMETMVLPDGTITDFVDATGVMAGDSVSKIVTVENTGVGDAWVRIAVDKTMTSPEGIVLDADVMTFDLGTDWVDGADGFYYYSVALPSGDTTSPLWEEVIFSTTMGDAYQGATGTIDVTVYAVQVANNPIPEGGDITDIVGWPE